MNLVYAHSYRTALVFAQHHEFAAGDWKFIQDADVVRHYPRSDVYLVEHWERNPHRDTIDLALQRARQTHRLGAVIDVNQAQMGVGLGH